MPNLAMELAGHAERIDHSTLEAQRIEALELAHVTQEQGHEAEALEHTVRAVALDRPPLPQLSAGAWQLKERGQEVAARMREAWALRDVQSDFGEKRSAISEERSEEPDASQSLADRLRAASKGLDHEEISARLDVILQGREVEGQDKARELERVKAERYS